MGSSDPNGRQPLAKASLLLLLVLLTVLLAEGLNAQGGGVGVPKRCADRDSAHQVEPKKPSPP
jgi:hypothetical protein